MLLLLLSLNVQTVSGTPPPNSNCILERGERGELAVITSVASKTWKFCRGGMVSREPEPALQYVSAVFTILYLLNAEFRAHMVVFRYLNT